MINQSDVTPKLNLWYKFSNCCCQTNQSCISRWQKNEYRCTYSYWNSRGCNGSL